MLPASRPGGARARSVAPAAEAPAAPAPPVVIPWDPATYCVLAAGRLQLVEIDPRDSTYQGQPIAQAFPVDSTYARDASWYVRSGPILLRDDMYVRYGLPRLLATTDVVPVAAYRGVTVFAERGVDPTRPDVIYIPTRPGCEFQPYERHGSKE
jgi:hypothetical protein